MADNNLNTLGRKIFFLYPSAVIQNQIVSMLTQEEFEVYCCKNETRLRQGFKKFPDSIVFANLNEGLKENVWEEWIKGVISDPEASGIDVGIVAANENLELRRKYTDQLKVRCGFTVLKSDLSAVVKQLIGLLDSVNAKGRRKYIRAVTENEANTTVNLPVNGTFVNGIIKDVSTVGFSCSFAEDPELTKNSLVSDIQIRLATQLIKAEGIIFGSRMDGDQKIYVILFSQKISPDVRTRIRKFIQFFLQARMDNDLNKA